MPALPPAYRSIILDQQDQLQRLVKSAGVAPVRALYDRMIADLERRIGAARAGTFTHQQLRILMAQMRLGLADLQRASGDAVESSVAAIGVHAARTMLTDAAKLEHHFTGAAMPLPLLEAGRLEGLVQGHVPSLLRAHESSMANWGTQVVRRFEGELALSLAGGESHAQAIARVTGVADMEWYRAERIVRTELAFAANRSARQAADDQAEELDGDMWSRWTEHVSDSGLPLDDRVGVDSEAMHGQVAHPGGTFTQPPANRQGDLVSESLVGREWTCPPNRPNDRAVLVPWRSHWGVPGWQWEDGKRVPVTEERAQRQNERWMRGRAAPPDIGSAPAPEEDVAPEEAAPTGIGFQPAEAPELMPEEIPARASVKIPTREEIPAAGRVDPAVDPQAIADHGWHEPAGYGDDLARAERAYQEVADGLDHPVAIGLTPRDNLVVHDEADAARLNAAAHADLPIPVRWERAHAVPGGHVEKAGVNGAAPGLSEAPDYVVPTSNIRGAEKPKRELIPGTYERIELRDGVHYRHLISGRVYPASDFGLPSEPAATSAFQPGPREERRDAYEPTPDAAERARADRHREIESGRRQRDRQERESPPPAPPGYRLEEDFPGVLTYVSERTGRRYTVDDVRRGTLDQRPAAADFPAAQAKLRAEGFLSRIGRGIRSIGRAIAGRA